MRIAQISMVVCALTTLSGCGALAGPSGKDGVDGERGPRGEAGPPGAQPNDATRSGERLKATFLVGDDGAKTPAGWVDSQTGLPCAFATAADGVMRCLPIVPRDAWRALYADEACMSQAIAVAEIGAACDALGPYVVAPSYGQCNHGDAVYSVGVQYFGDKPVAYSDAEGCKALGSANIDMFTLTAVDPASFVAAVIK